MSSKNENIANNENMTYEERIEVMKKNMGLKFVEEGKTILKNGKVLKGEDAYERFNTELNELTFELEELYPLDYDSFKKEFPRTIELVDTITGGVVVNSVEKGLVIQGFYVETNVNEIIQNIKDNVSDEQKRKEYIKLRKDVQAEILRMKNEFDIDWCEDLFWKTWKIKEGEKRWNYLVKTKGEKVAKNKIDTIRKVGGLAFLEVLQNEIYGKN